MLTITLHAPNSPCSQLDIDNLDVPLFTLLRKLAPDASLEHTDIGLDSDFINIIVIDETTTVSTVFPKGAKLSAIDLYLRPRLPSRIKTRRGAIALQDIEYGDGLILFNHSGTIARPNTPESDEASSSQMPSALTIEPKNQKQKIIEKFGTKLIQLVGNQLGKSSKLFIDIVTIVRSYTPQTDLESYFSTITEFLQATIGGELQTTVQSLIVKYVEKIALVDEASPAVLPRLNLTYNDCRMIARLTDEYLLTIITTSHSEQSEKPVFFTILKDREILINKIAKRITESSKQHYKFSDTLSIVSDTFDAFFEAQDMPTASFVTDHSPSEAAAAPSLNIRNASYPGFFPPSLPRNVSSNAPSGETLPANPAPTYSGNMDDVD